MAPVLKLLAELAQELRSEIVEAEDDLDADYRARYAAVSLIMAIENVVERNGG